MLRAVSCEVQAQILRRVLTTDNTDDTDQAEIRHNSQSGDHDNGGGSSSFAMMPVRAYPRFLRFRRFVRLPVRLTETRNKGVKHGDGLGRLPEVPCFLNRLT